MTAHAPRTREAELPQDTVTQAMLGMVVAKEEGGTGKKVVPTADFFFFLVEKHITSYEVFHSLPLPPFLESSAFLLLTEKQI